MLLDAINEALNKETGEEKLFYLILWTWIF